MNARLDLVRHLIENSELVPLVRGPDGIGKSVMASRLQQSAPDNWAVCHFSADSMMQPERLLSHIARCNGLPDAPGENLTRLEDRYAQLRKRGRTPVLLVDDAQTLPPTSLITLLRLYERQVGGAPLVSLVLFANEQIDMLLSTPQLQIMTPQAIQVIDLPPFTREEATGFMRYVVMNEGLDEHFLLDDTKLNRIFRETRGIAGPMASAVLAAVGEDEAVSKPVGNSMKRQLLIFGLPLLALILLILVFQSSINRLFESPETSRPEVVKEEAIRLPDPVERKAVADTRLPIPVLAEPEPPVNPPNVEPIEPVPVLAETTAPPDISVAPGAVMDPAMTEKPVSPAAPGVDQAESETAVVAETNVAQRPEAQVEQVVETPLPPSSVSERAAQEAAASKPVIVEEKKKVLPAAAPSKPAPAAKVVTVVTTESFSSNVVDGLLKPQAWLAKQPKGSYTIQLLAVESIDSIKPVIARHGIAEKAFTIETQRNGKPWFPLLWGVFPDRPAALAALKQLPPSLQKGGAWARAIASLEK